METALSMNGKVLNLLVLSDFNAANLQALLNKGDKFAPWRATCAPFGQVLQTLLEPNNLAWDADTRTTLVWTLPESVIPAYRKLLASEEVQPESLMAEVDYFCDAVKSIPAGVEHIFVPTWVAAPYDGRMGLLDMHSTRGASLALLRMNARLVENLCKDPRVFVLDASRWVAAQGEKSFSPRLWYMSKTPFSVELFREATLEIHAAFGALFGQSKKLVVVDLDDTLWGGIVGDIGWQNLRVGGHDPVGEAFRDFQLSLKALKTRGILLGMVSKNEENTALEAIRSHPEMILRLEDFAGWRINWNDKAQNISELAGELNLGLQSVVFIDDNPIERDRVRAALAEVLVPDWPATPMEYKTSLQRLRCFDQAQISSEDQRRAEMYLVEKKRRGSLNAGQSLNDWLLSLQTRVLAEPINPANLDRVTQLFNKTNQMNLSTRRLQKHELSAWAGQPANTMLAFRVSDKFGDYGLAGIASLSAEDLPDGEAQLIDLILSCRVMGRKVEETMLHLICVFARSSGAVRLRAIYLPTQKNQPCLRFVQTCGFQSAAKDEYLLDLTPEACPKPAEVELELAPGLETLMSMGDFVATPNGAGK